MEYFIWIFKEDGAQKTPKFEKIKILKKKIVENLFSFEKKVLFGAELQ
jgi:hypothetical protein